MRPASPLGGIAGTQIHQNAATILPPVPRRLILFNALGMRQMLAGMVLLSAAVGMVALATAVVLSMPTWVVLAIYPVVCSLTLLLAATLFSLRSGRPARAERTLHPQV